MDRPAHSSLLTKSSSSTRLEKILSMKKQKPSTDRRALNEPSSLSIDVNSELEKKAVEKEAQCGTTGGFDGPS